MRAAAASAGQAANRHRRDKSCSNSKKAKRGRPVPLRSLLPIGCNAAEGLQERQLRQRSELLPLLLLLILCLLLLLLPYLCLLLPLLLHLGLLLLLLGRAQRRLVGWQLVSLGGFCSCCCTSNSRS